MQSQPEEVKTIRVLLTLEGANRETFLEELGSSSKVNSLSHVGNIVNFRTQLKNVEDLPQPEGVTYRLSRPVRNPPMPGPDPRPAPRPGPCTQVVMEMVNPETGEKMTATDGCVVDDLKAEGWIPAMEYEGGGNGGNGGSQNGSGNGDDGGSQTAGVSTTNIAVVAGGAAAIGLLAYAGS
jgi:hypothetical protein